MSDSESSLHAKIDVLLGKRRRINFEIDALKDKLADMEEKRVQRRAVSVSWPVFKRLAQDKTNWQKVAEFDAQGLGVNGCKSGNECYYIRHSNRAKSATMYTFNIVDSYRLSVCDMCLEQYDLPYWFEFHDQIYKTGSMLIDPECLSESGKKTLAEREPPTN